MAATLPRPSRPSLPTITPPRVGAPPSGPLPQLPGRDTPSRTLRRPASFSVFPQPPKSRVASLPPSPLATVHSGAPPTVGARSSSTTATGTSTPTSSSAASRLKRPTTVGPGVDSPSSIKPMRNVSMNSSMLSLPSTRSPSRASSYEATLTVEPADYSAITSGDSGNEKTDNVTISVRVRPNDGDPDGRTEKDWSIDGRTSKVGYNGKDGGDYFYDHVFGPGDGNSKVYDSSAKRLVRRVMEGYHGTVFAYGMTGTGKTFSMQGTTGSPGVIPQAVTDIFAFIRETPHREFLLRVSYLEIYNERIHDLLSAPLPTSGSAPPLQQPVQEEIKLREDSKRGVYATPLKEEIVQSPTQLLRVIARGDLARRTGSTQFNERSSRSHAVVQIVVESRDRLPGVSAGSSSSLVGSKGVTGGVRVSTLSLIDLAGSERAADNKERRQEGAHINKSLLTLGNVIARLSDSKDKDNVKAKDGSHLPYRDSKLTRLLQPALQGSSLISILCTIAVGGAPGAVGNNVGETLNTLKFAARAKNNIVSHAKRAEESHVGDAGSRVLMERYRFEISDLRTQLEEANRRENDRSLKEEIEAHRETKHEERNTEQLIELQLARTALKERIEHLNRLVLHSKSSGVNANNHNSVYFGQPGHMSAMSMRSSMNTGSFPHMSRTFSGNEVSPPRLSRNSSEMLDEDEPEFDPTGGAFGEFGDGTASLQAQVRALQADLADKNRYIGTLEKRLLQARRSSHSRMSSSLSSPPHKLVANSSDEVGVLLREKDAEIADLRARLDDKERMVGALRSAVRGREVAEISGRASVMSTSSTLFGPPASAPPTTGTRGLPSPRPTGGLKLRTTSLNVVPRSTARNSAARQKTKSHPPATLASTSTKPKRHNSTGGALSAEDTDHDDVLNTGLDGTADSSPGHTPSTAKTSASSADLERLVREVEMESVDLAINGLLSSPDLDSRPEAKRSVSDPLAATTSSSSMLTDLKGGSPKKVKRDVGTVGVIAGSEILKDNMKRATVDDDDEDDSRTVVVSPPQDSFSSSL